MQEITENYWEPGALREKIQGGGGEETLFFATA